MCLIAWIGHTWICRLTVRPRTASLSQHEHATRSDLGFSESVEYTWVYEYISRSDLVVAREFQ